MQERVRHLHETLRSKIAIRKRRFGGGLCHVAATLTRDQHADVFVGTIIEGPSKWKVRPVAEVFYENEFGASQTVSGLIGAIWQVNDKLSFDIGLRHALTNGRHADEILAGLT